MLMMAIAAAVSAETWITNDDYPSRSLLQHHEGMTTVELTVDTGGKIANCTVAVSSGWQELDDATCALLRKRARYAPASFAGQPVGYVYHLRFAWLIGSYRPPLPPDTELDINLAKLPPSVTQPSATLEFMVAANGKVEACRAQDGKGSGSAALDKAVCASMSKSEVFPPALDGDGKPMRFLRVQKVGFTIDAPK